MRKWIISALAAAGLLCSAGAAAQGTGEGTAAAAKEEAGLRSAGLQNTGRQNAVLQNTENGQTAAPDSSPIVRQLEGSLTEAARFRPAVEQRRHADYRGWARLLPTHCKLQYAGGMGVASIGFGWDYGRRNQWETDLQIGWLPKHFIGTGEGRATFTLRESFIPWNIRCHRQLGIEPFSCGIYLNFIAGEEFWMQEPQKYGGPYYRFSTRMRAYIYVGQRITWYHRNPRSLLRSIGFYYELSAKELDLLAKCTNRELSIADIFYFSFGVRVQLMKP